MEKPLILNEVVEFLRAHPEVSVRKLSVMAKVPGMSLYRLLSGEHRDVVSIVADRLRAVMKSYEDGVNQIQPSDEGECS